MIKKENRFRIIAFIACVIVLAGIARSFVTIAQKRGIIAERRAILKREQARRTELEAKLREATGSAFVERQAREKLGLVKEGERIVIMDQSLTTGSAQASAEATPSWKQWWELFF